MSVINKVNGPSDIKNLSAKELEELAEDVRALILNRDSKVGGHVGPNLGVVEMTIALHRVFNSPTDKLIWDVSHQSYPHKILTGRKIGYMDGHFHDISGFTNPHESEHDFFNVGHTSTSIANAIGMAQARDMLGETGNIIAIIGDGSLSGGLAFEALNNADQCKNNLIIIVNDNEMSIDQNQGGLYKNLAKLRETSGTADNNFFKAFGLDYKYLESGNDIQALIELFESVKDIDHPIVLHIHTEKGHGYAPAIAEKSRFHWSGPFDLTTGTGLGKNQRSYNDVIVDYMDKKIEEGMKLLAINAAIPGALGLTEFYKKHPENYWDAGIAEQFTVTFGGAAALAGIRTIIIQESTFFQRAFDQLMHDVAMNEEPTVILVKGDVISAADSSHQGDFARSWISNVPNLDYLAPTSEEELIAMLDWALTQHEKPVVINIPEHGIKNRPTTLTTFDVPTYQITQSGSEVAILGLGGLYDQAKKVVSELENVGIKATLVNPLFISQLDETTLVELTKKHKVIATFEDGTVDGGFGQKVASYLGNFDVKVLNFGAAKEFNDEIPTEELYMRYHLTPQLAVSDILAALGK